MVVATRARASTTGVRVERTRRPTTPLIVLTVAIAVWLSFSFATADVAFSSFATSKLLESGRPNIVSRDTLACLRGIFGVVIIGSLAQRFFSSDQIVVPIHYPQSRLQPGVGVRLSGFRIFTTFTVQAWAIQGIYFLGTFALWILTTFGGEAIATGSAPHTLVCCLWVLYEVSFACAFLVLSLIHI